MASASQPVTDTTVTDHEKSSLPAHVENCAVRYAALAREMKLIRYLLIGLALIVLLGGKDGVSLIKMLLT